MIEGRVFKSTGSWYEVRTSELRLYQCRIAGKIRLKGLPLTNPVGVGDRVLFEPEAGSDTNGLIRDILPRTNYVVRQSPRQKHHLHLIAANIDQAMLTVTVSQPMLKPGFIDRYLLMTEPMNIPAIIVFNKTDLYTAADRVELAFFREVYAAIGYKTLGVSALTGDGIGTLRELLAGKTTLAGGQSGVGKSSLINALYPGMDLRSGEISGYTGKGMHTTTFAEMFPVADDTFIIDTPGIKSLSYNDLEPMDVAHNFREFFALSAQCRFGARCSHTAEPGCAVLTALEEGAVSEYRYQNYLSILTEIKSQNHWERKDMRR